MIRGQFTIRDVADQLGIAGYTIQYAERVGKLAEPARDPISGYAVYSDEDVQRIKERFGLTDARVRALRDARRGPKGYGRGRLARHASEPATA